MKFGHQDNGLPGPRWDGSRIIFTLAVEGRQIRCGISRDALSEACGSPYMRDGDFLAGFLRSQTRIEGIAAAIFAKRPGWVTDTLNIWADDITDPPAAPATAQSLAHPGQS